MSGQAPSVAIVPGGVLIVFMARPTRDDMWGIWMAEWSEESGEVAASELVYEAPSMSQVAPETATLAGGRIRPGHR